MTPVLLSGPHGGTTHREVELLASLPPELRLIGGLAVFGRDGRMATYAALVVASALALWWAGFRARSSE